MTAKLYQIYMKWFPIPLPPPGSFSGKTAVVTGGTGGLGLAAAAHLINLGASEVIISSRDPSRSQKALDELRKITQGRSEGKIRVLSLDMEEYTSVVGFANEIKDVKKGKGGIDIVILNAGIIGVDPKLTANGWEQNIQVNTLSTVLLAALLLPQMKAERVNRPSPAHLSIVGSMRFADPDIDAWAAWESEEGDGILEHLSKPGNWPGGSDMYAATKLLVMYAFRELVKRALAVDGRPEVILNTMCPGVVKTDLSRHYTAKSAMFAVLVPVFTGMFGKSPENGARTYMAAVTTKEEDHGRIVQFYKSEKELRTLEDKVLNSRTGEKMQSLVWKAITRELTAKVPETGDIL